MHMGKYQVILNKVDLNSPVCPFCKKSIVDVLKGNVITCELAEGCFEKCSAFGLFNTGSIKCNLN